MNIKRFKRKIENILTPEEIAKLRSSSENNFKKSIRLADLIMMKAEQATEDLDWEDPYVIKRLLDLAMVLNTCTTTMAVCYERIFDINFVNTLSSKLDEETVEELQELKIEFLPVTPKEEVDNEKTN